MTEVVFLHKEWMLPIITGAIFLVLLFIWKEWAAAGRKWFVLKIGVSLVAIAGLVMLALKPATPVSFNLEKTILLTEGYQQQQLDSLKALLPGIEVEHYTPGRPQKEELRLGREVLILGNGLEAFDLWQLEGVPVHYLGGEIPKGLVKINYPRENSVGDRWEFKGSYAQPAMGNSLILEGPGGAALDSVTFQGEESETFTLSTELLVEGNYLFSIVEKDSIGGTLQNDPIPVQVGPARVLKILIVNAFPSFETKYLKNYLAEAGHELVVRSQITRGRFRYEFFNTDRVPIGSLDEARLEAFDLLVIDANSLAALPQARVTALEKAVKRGGLGVFIQPDLQFFTSGHALHSFNLVSHAATEIVQEGIEIPKAAFAFTKDSGLEVIHGSEVGIFSAYERIGAGRIGTSVFEKTFQLLLDGHEKTYQKIWSETLEQLAKDTPNKAAWDPDTDMAFVDKPFRFKLRTELASPRVEEAHGNIPLKRDVMLQNLWEGTTWPRVTGWQRQALRSDSTTTFDYYVTDSSHWSALVAQNTISENLRYFKDRKLVEEELRVFEPIDPLWFYFIFLVSMTFLWIEPKYFT